MKHNNVITTLVVLLMSTTIFAQLSDLHYLPPLKQNGAAIQIQKIYLSTPEINPFTVKVYLGINNIPLTSFTLSKSSEYQYNLPNQDNNITFVTESNTGIVLNNSGLRFESDGGQKFYVNFRGNSNNQGSSLTSKGRAALGKSFKWGGAPIVGGSPTNATLGIIATEDNTTVNIFGYDPSTTFRLGNLMSGITSNTLTIELDAGESYVLESVISNNITPDKEANADGWLGASITSTKDIAVSVGSLHFSSRTTGGQDCAIDQIIPENVLGKEYVFVRGYGSDDLEYPVIIATQNDTDIYVNGSATPIVTINNGDYYKISGSNYSGLAETRKGENMFVRASKEVYAFQGTAGANSPANVDYNFIAPINFLLNKKMDYIPNINEVGDKTITGGICIISDATVSDSDLEVNVNGSRIPIATLTLSKRSVAGTPLWNTYYIDGLTGDVSVNSIGSIAVGFMGQSGVIGVSGYFSGFESIPSININVTTQGECLTQGGVTLTAPSGYKYYQWYRGLNPINGEVSSTYLPSLAGVYKVEVTSNDNIIYLSAPQDVNDCNPEMVLSITADKNIVKLNENITFLINAKHYFFKDANNIEIANVLPDNIQIISVIPSYGTWSNTNNIWSIDNMKNGEEHVLRVTAKAVSVTSNSVSYSVSNSQTVFGTDGITMLVDGNSIEDDLSELFVVDKGVNSVTISGSNSITKTVIDSNFTISPSSSNTNPFNYNSSNEGVAQVDSNGVVSILNIGSTSIIINQEADTNYKAGALILTLVVTKANPIISGFSNISKTYGDSNFEIIAPSSTSDGSFTYASSSSNVTISGSTITINGAGNVIITAIQASTSNYNSGTITASLNVSKANQSISIEALPTSSPIIIQVRSGPLPLLATSSSGNGIDITVPSGSIGTISGTTGNYTLSQLSSSGILSITYIALGDTNYNVARTTISLDVDKIPQSIDFIPAMPSNISYTIGLETPITAVSSSVSHMIYSVISGPAIVSADKLHITGAGTIEYSINNTGDDIYTAAPEVRKVLSIPQGATNLSAFNLLNKNYLDSAFTILAPNSNRVGEFIYSSSDPTIARVSGSTLIIYTPGTTIITATQIATTNFLSASISTSFTVGKATPNITGLVNIIKYITDSEFNLSVSSSLPSEPMVYNSSNISVAFVDPTTGTVSINGLGTTIISATQNSNFYFNEASISAILTVQLRDSDGDGVLNTTEIIEGTDANDQCDFVLESQNKTTSSAWNLGDCDGDGVINSDELTDVTNPLKADTDGDGVIDGTEKTDATDGIDICSYILAHQTLATSSAWNLGDCDGDGVTNSQEILNNTDPLDGDTDGDGVVDTQENIDGTDRANACDFTISNQTLATSSAWNLGDCDGDGVTNSQEILNNTDPLAGDTDGDGVVDTQENIDGTNRTDTCDFIISNQTLATSSAWNLGDCDGDGVTNFSEKTLGLDPLLADTDGDGLSDGLEIASGTDPLITDTDSDGIADNIDNCLLVANNNQADNDQDSVGDICDIDDDNDGILDTDDNCPITANENQADRDRDGKGDDCDLIELNITNAITPNGDGVNDSWVIYNIENYPGSKVRVFNRWGKEVYSSSYYKNDWDGHYKDMTEGLPTSGAYFYQIDLNGDGTIDAQGWLYITK